MITLAGAMMKKDIFKSLGKEKTNALEKTGNSRGKYKDLSSRLIKIRIAWKVISDMKMTEEQSKEI